MPQSTSVLSLPDDAFDLQVEADADITVFDPETVIDRADFQGLKYSEGISYVLVNGILVVTAHFVAHHMTAQILGLYLYALPALGLGVFLASRVDRRVNRQQFRILVSMLVLILGGILLLGVG